MIYFYGGAFNPLTLAHQEIINTIASEINGYKDTLIIGVTTHDYKTYDYNDQIRYEMIFQHMSKRYGLSLRWKVFYQFDRTWNFFHKIFSEEEQKDICLVVGQDEYDDLVDGKWNFSEEILANYKFKIIPRTNNISSTKVREIFKNNEVINYEDVQELVSKEIFEFLTEFKQFNQNEKSQTN